MIRYNKVMDFMVKNQRNPSLHYNEEKLKHYWVHYNRKLLNSGQMKEERKKRMAGEVQRCPERARSGQANKAVHTALYAPTTTQRISQSQT